MNDDETTLRDPRAEARDAERLRARIAAVLRRAARAVPVHRADGTVFLRGRRKADRLPSAADRRLGDERRKG